ncbi:MAG: exopolyphosphatase [Lachnospiraceae bacterium]|jgi:exopolyphosphatase/guanosine-5'-triphosphate,3'-diphosphate pyrophosphatase|nr:exopolyphosphatase [Lachnospiraceae bacterium]
MAGRLFAAIDVGSFELEMAVYELASKNRIRRLDHIRHVIALGKDTYNTGKISYKLVDEMCMVLGDFVRIMKSYKVADYRAYATSAMREATNSQIVLDQIRVRTGLSVRVISNSEQRFLSYKAIAAQDEAFDKNIRKGTAIVDVSFGSMQVSLFDKNLLISTENLPLGVLKIRGILQDVNTTVDRTRELTEEMVENELHNYKKMHLKDREIKHLIGIGENILYLFRYEDQGKLLERVSREQFEELYAQICKMNEEQIEERFGVSASYAKLLLPSAVIYQKFMEMTGAEMIWVPGIRLCDGMAAEFAAEHKLTKFKHNFDNDIISTSRSMAKRYRCVSAHSEVVEAYVLQIFDTMKRYHGMGERERLLLQIAVIIHACGKFISVRNANECAYNIIMATEIIGISHVEREIIANIVRYNIRDFDYNMIRMEAQLDSMTEGLSSHKEAVIVIAKLTAILRLANSMDRGHGQKLKDCRMAVKDGELVVTTDYHGDITLEAVSFGQKAAFFEEIFGIRPVLKQKRSV